MDRSHSMIPRRNLVEFSQALVISSWLTKDRRRRSFLILRSSSSLEASGPPASLYSRK
jgi:hypothetical protein